MKMQLALGDSSKVFKEAVTYATDKFVHAAKYDSFPVIREIADWITDNQNTIVSLTLQMCDPRFVCLVGRHEWTLDMWDDLVVTETSDLPRSRGVYLLVGEINYTGSTGSVQGRMSGHDISLAKANDPTDRYSKNPRVTVQYVHEQMAAVRQSRRTVVPAVLHEYEFHDSLFLEVLEALIMVVLGDFQTASKRFQTQLDFAVHARHPGLPSPPWKGGNRSLPLSTHPASLRQNDELGQYKCYLCGEHFVHTYDVDAHVRAVHDPLAAPWKCDDCGKEFMEHIRLYQHRNGQCLPVECEYCGDVVFEARLEAHQQTLRCDLHRSEIEEAEAAGLPPSPCEFCEAEPRTIRLLDEHLYHVHAAPVDGDDRARCPFLGCSFSRPWGEKYGVFVEHVRVVHRGEDPTEWQCPYCDRMMNKNVANTHRSVVHPVEYAAERKAAELAREEQRQAEGALHCPHEDCPKFYMGKYAGESLTRHLQKVHSVDAEQKKADKEAELLAEVKAGTAFPCPEEDCTKVYRGKFGQKNLKTHLRNDHAKEEDILRCPYPDCIRSYAGKSARGQLSRHLKLAHKEDDI